MGRVIWHDEPAEWGETYRCHRAFGTHNSYMKKTCMRASHSPCNLSFEGVLSYTYFLLGERVPLHAFMRCLGKEQRTSCIKER